MSDLRIGSLCSGFGGLDMAVVDVLDASVAWHCQYDPDDKHQYAARILAHHWPDVPNHGDITAIDWRLVEPVDILTAGFPCQDLSLAGKREGMRDGNRSGLWFHVARAIETLRPRLVVIENVPGILSSAADGDMEPCPWCLGDLGRKRRPLRALGAVLADLARLGFDAEWTSLDAADVGAPHKRRRVFLAAWPADPEGPRLEGRREGRLGGVPAAAVAGAPADAESERRGEGRPESARLVGGSNAPERGRATAADAGRLEPERRGGPGVLGGPAPAEPREGRQRERAGDAVVGRRTEALDWGAYGPAIARWELVMGRPAPAPTEPGKNGPRLAPRFVEWLMGLAAGWVTDLDIPRNAQLKALGNGVVRQQGTEALRRLLAQAPVRLIASLNGSSDLSEARS